MKKILFNDRYGLTNAVLESRKTMTRRIVSEGDLRMAEMEVRKLGGNLAQHIKEHSYYCYWEKVAIAQRYKDIFPNAFKMVGNELITKSKGWSNKLFVKAKLMPSAIQITNIRTERLQDISEEDCLKEGIRAYKGAITPLLTKTCCYGSIDFFPPYGFDDYESKLFYNYFTPKEAYSQLIDCICGKGTWDSNPWVFVYDFELMKGGVE